MLGDAAHCREQFVHAGDHCDLWPFAGPAQAPVVGAVSLQITSLQRSQKNFELKQHAAFRWRQRERPRSLRLVSNGVTLQIIWRTTLRGIWRTGRAYELSGFTRVDSRAGYFEPQPLPDHTWNFMKPAGASF